MTPAELLNYQFSDQQLLAAAVDLNSEAGQRLEWLGDRVLSCCIAQLLYEQHPHRSEGELSRAIVRLVTNNFLIQFGEQLDLPALDSSRVAKKARADVIESLLGAVFLDGGFVAALNCVKQLFRDTLSNPAEALWERDAKSLLKEYCDQQQLETPQYFGEQLADHYEATCMALEHQASATADTKAHAENQAAAKLINLLEIN